MNSPLTVRLLSAVNALTGHGALKDRLVISYCEYLEKVPEQDLPEEVRAEFTAMKTALHSARALPGDSVVRASVRKLSNDEAQHFASLIVRIYGLRVAESSAAMPLPGIHATPPTPPVAPLRPATPLAALLALDNAVAVSAARNKIASSA
jgi:hypothetical protein